MATLAIVIIGNIVLQGAAFIIMKPDSPARWTLGAVLIGAAYSLSYWVQQ